MGEVQGASGGAVEVRQSSTRVRLTALCLLLAVACGPTPRPPAEPATTAPAIRSPTPTRPITRTPPAAATATPTPRASTTPQATPTPFFGQVWIPHATVTYYRIRGATAEALRAQMDAKGLVDEAGDRVDALTKWYISWHWPGIGWRVCVLAAASVAYNVQVTLPRWDPPAEATSALRARWLNYITALAEHERRHVNFVVNRQADIERAIAAATCLTADAAAQRQVEYVRQLDLLYDLSTEHGATEGVVFP